MRKFSFAILFSLLCCCLTARFSFADTPDDLYRNYYEIFVYSYYDTDGDGIGDLKGVEEKLDYIADMGFTGIWLMPVMPSPSYHKYDVTDYQDIDPQYGSLADFQSLTDACHERGIRLIIDLVMNHSSSEHPWFLEACDYLRSLADGKEPDAAQCPYVAYYHFSKETVSDAWHPVDGTEWFYEGSFGPHMPDLNLGCEDLKKEIEKIASFWIEKGVDGFRIDAALHFEESSTDFNVETLNWLYSYCLQEDPDFYMVSEVWDGEQIIAGYYASQTPSMFDFPLSGAEGALCKAARGDGSVSKLVKTMQRLEELYGGVYPAFIDAPFLTNHDQPRIANALSGDPDALKIAGGLLLMMGGNPFVYYGEEIGMKSDGKEDENKRLPMNWSSDPEAKGITAGPPNCNKDYEQKLPSQEEQLEDPDSVLHYYKRALELRNRVPEIARGKTEVVEDLCDRTQAVIIKNRNDSYIGIVYNTGDEAVQIDVNGTDLIYGQLEGALTLHPDEQILYENGILEMPARSIAVV
ncbi:MAG: alpha amylase, partial [Clostridiales bacterium]|nr:alpha amylase [Candidatus Blautia equi]